jgi:hypothetical protein
MEVFIMNNKPYDIGDLVVYRYAEFNDSFFAIYKVKDVEYVNEDSEMWFDGVDEEPYYAYECEIIYIKSLAPTVLEKGDIVYYEEEDLISMNKYLDTRFTIQDYINVMFNNKDIEF